MIIGVVGCQVVFLGGGGRLGLEIGVGVMGWLIYGFERGRGFAGSVQMMTLGTTAYFWVFVLIDIGILGIGLRSATFCYGKF